MSLFLLLSSLLFGIFLLRLNLLLSTSHIRAGPVWRPRDRAAREELGRTSREGRVEPRTAWGLRHPQRKDRAEPGAHSSAAGTALSALPDPPRLGLAVASSQHCDLGPFAGYGCVLGLSPQVV